MLFRHRKNSSYALGVVAETSGGDRFYTVPVLSDIFFAVRQTEDIWVILVFDGSEEHMMRIRFSPGKEPAVLTAEPLSSEVNRCIVNRRGHILIGYDNSGFFSDTQNIEDFSPIADISISHAFAGENGIVLPLMEWYDSDGKLIHMFIRQYQYHGDGTHHRRGGQGPDRVRSLGCPRTPGTWKDLLRGTRLPPRKDDRGNH